MPKLYCASCGHPTIYDVSRPQFCSSCGKNFSDSMATKKARSIPARPLVSQIEEYDDEDDEDEDDYTSETGGGVQLGKFKTIRDSITVHIDDVPQSTGTVGAIIKEGSAGGPMGLEDNVRNRHKKRINKKEFLREWQTKNGAEKPAAKEVGAGVKANTLLIEKRSTPKKKSSRRQK